MDDVITNIELLDSVIEDKKKKIAILEQKSHDELTRDFGDVSSSSFFEYDEKISAIDKEIQLYKNAKNDLILQIINSSLLENSLSNIDSMSLREKLNLKKTCDFVIDYYEEKLANAKKREDKMVTLEFGSSADEEFREIQNAIASLEDKLQQANQINNLISQKLLEEAKFSLTDSEERKPSTR